jgi:hypothetical protein
MALSASGRSSYFSRRSRHTSGMNWSKVSWAARRGLARWPRMRVLVALAVVAALGWLFVAAQASRGNKCHFNVHFAQKVVCTKPDHAGYPQRG